MQEEGEVTNYSSSLGNWISIPYSVQFSHSVVSSSLWPHGLQHTRFPCSSPTPRAYSNSWQSSWWCHPTISSSLIPFSSCLQSFPASGSFPMSQFFASGGPSIGSSASALPMNIQDWFPLGSTGLISLQFHISINVYGQWTTVMYMLHAQLCSALSNLMDCSPQDSSVHGISRKEYWNWLLFPSPGNLLNWGTEPESTL